MKLEFLRSKLRQLRMPSFLLGRRQVAVFLTDLYVCDQIHLSQHNRAVIGGEPASASGHFNIYCQANITAAVHRERWAKFPPVLPETRMRRFATLCFPTLLGAISAPALAANDSVIIFAPAEVRAAENAFVAATPVPAPAPGPVRGRYGGGFIEAILTGAESQPQTAAPTASEPGAGGEAKSRAGAAISAAGSRVLRTGGARNACRRHAR